MNSNTLIQHVRELNIREKQDHDEKRKAAIERIKELRQRIRLEQENAACADTTRSVS